MTGIAIEPGPRNLITDVEGIRVGNAEDERAWTGVTVVLPDAPAVAAVDVRGGGPGSRETEALGAAALVQEVHAVVLSGGSAFGLDAGSAAAAWLAARGIGFAIAGTHVPIVPAAILFDLANGGDKGWGETPPYAALARAACERVGHDFALGNSGAGYGAKAGRLKGGLGSASAVMAADGLRVGALVAANPVGSAVMPGDDCFWAWPFEQRGELGGQHPPRRGAVPPGADLDLFDRLAGAPPDLPANTTIAVVATDAALTRVEAQRLAIMAQDGLARAIRPIHSPFDGDTVFALATGRRALPEPRAVALGKLGTVAADCLARAVARGVFEAAPLGSWPAYRDRHRAGFGGG
jgi:L-aminopeptidase/D-esterase-like protein